MTARKQKMNMSVQYSLHAKITFNINLVGKKSVGKSSLATREIKDIFGAVPKASEGFQFYSKIKKLKNEQVSIQIWDTVTNVINIERPIIIQLDDEEFFQKSICYHFEKQISDLRQQVNQYAPQGTKFCLIRTKIDANPVTQKQREKLKNLLDVIYLDEIFYHGEVSSKTGENVNKYFSQLINLMFKSYEQEQDFREAVSPSKDSFFLNSVCTSDFSHCKKSRKCC